MAAVLQIVLSAGLVWLVARNVAWDDIRELVLRVDAPRWLGGMALSLAWFAACSLRSRALLRMAGIDIPLQRVAAVNLESMLFVFVLPGDVAGGVVRWFRFAADPGTGSRVAACIVVERLADVAMLFLLGLGGAFQLVGGGSNQATLNVITVVAGCGLVSIVSLIVLAGAFGRGLERFGAWASARSGPRARRIVGHLHATVVGVDTIRRAHGWLPLIAWTATATAASFIGGWLIAISLVPGVPAGPFVVAEAILALAMQVPVTFAGVGLYEALAPRLVGGFGVDQAAAVLIALGNYLRMAAFAAAGLVARLRLGRPEP